MQREEYTIDEVRAYVHKKVLYDYDESKDSTYAYGLTTGDYYEILSITTNIADNMNIFNIAQVEINLNNNASNTSKMICFRDLSSLVS